MNNPNITDCIRFCSVCDKSIIYVDELCENCKPWCYCWQGKANSKDDYGIIAGFCYKCTPKCSHGFNPYMCDNETCKKSAFKSKIIGIILVYKVYLFVFLLLYTWKFLLPQPPIIVALILCFLWRNIIKDF